MSVAAHRVVGAMNTQEKMERIGFFRACADDCSALAANAPSGPIRDRLKEFASVWATMATQREETAADPAVAKDASSAAIVAA
jgi:hypothetical protein